MLHPLLVPNVLETLMDYLPIEDVKICRLVCSQWNYESSNSLRKRKKIKFPNLTTLMTYMSVYSESYLHCSIFPHCCFELQFQFSKNDVAVINQFFICFSEYIKLLSLIVGRNFFQGEDLSFILEILKNLETLQLHLCYSFNPNFVLASQSILLPSIKHLEIEVNGYDSVTECATTLLHSIFSVTPNLCSISYMGSPKRTPSKLKVLLTEIILTTPPEHLRKLAHVKFLMKLNEENLRNLIESQFSLQTLYLDLWNNNEDSENDTCVLTPTLQALTRQLAPTLTKFSVDFPWRKEVSYLFQFPVAMTRLHSLAVNGIEGSLIDLLKNLPQLHFLELSQLDLEEAFPRKTLSVPAKCCFHTTALKLEYCTNQSTVTIRRIARLFPHLHQLEITHVENNVALAIYKEMPGLFYLYMHGACLSDEGICGIPEQISKEENLAQCVLSCRSGDGEKLRRYNYIADLQELRRLELDSHLITDISVVYGIVDCKNLNHLILNYSELTEVSITAFEKKWGRTRCYESENRIVI